MEFKQPDFFKFGLKLWSTNENYVKEAVRLYEKGIYQYIEIYMVPGTEKKMIDMWKGLNIPYVVHAQHFREGLNLAKKEAEDINRRLIDETRKFADSLSAENIIVHPGIAGDIKETARQLKEINEPRLLVENKPYYALFDGLVCNGTTPEEIGFVMKEAGIGCCLDVGHAFCAARGLKKEPLEFLKEFLNLKPEMFHLTDGDYESVYDRHDHIGKGNYDIHAVLKLIPKGKRITVETVKDSKESLADFEEDILLLERLTEEEYLIELATEGDMLDVFKLASDPVVRKNSFSQEPIPFEDHIKWFKNKINSKDCVFYVIKDKDGELIGSSRFDKDLRTDVYIISIQLSHRYRGKGMGRQLIKRTSCMVLREKGCTAVVAYVKESNVISMKSFLKAGYEMIGNEKIDNSACYKLRFRNSEKRDCL